MYIMLAWMVNLLFFIVILIFVWSRIAVIRKKCSDVHELVQKTVEQKRQYRQTAPGGAGRQPAAPAGDSAQDSSDSAG